MLWKRRIVYSLILQLVKSIIINTTTPNKDRFPVLNYDDNNDTY